MYGRVLWLSNPFMNSLYQELHQDPVLSQDWPFLGLVMQQGLESEHRPPNGRDLSLGETSPLR